MLMNSMTTAFLALSKDAERLKDTDAPGMILDLMAKHKPRDASPEVWSMWNTANSHMMRYAIRGNFAELHKAQGKLQAQLNLVDGAVEAHRGETAAAFKTLEEKIDGWGRDLIQAIKGEPASPEAVETAKVIAQEEPLSSVEALETANMYVKGAKMLASVTGSKELGEIADVASLGLSVAMAFVAPNPATIMAATSAVMSLGPSKPRPSPHAIVMAMLARIDKRLDVIEQKIDRNHRSLMATLKTAFSKLENSLTSIENRLEELKLQVSDLGTMIKELPLDIQNDRIAEKLDEKVGPLRGLSGKLLRGSVDFAFPSDFDTLKKIYLDRSTYLSGEFLSRTPPNKTLFFAENLSFHFLPAFIARNAREVSEDTLGTLTPAHLQLTAASFTTFLGLANEPIFASVRGTSSWDSSVVDFISKFIIPDSAKLRSFFMAVRSHSFLDGFAHNIDKSLDVARAPKPTNLSWTVGSDGSASIDWYTLEKVESLQKRMLVNAASVPSQHGAITNIGMPENPFAEAAKKDKGRRHWNLQHFGLAKYVRGGAGERENNFLMLLTACQRLNKCSELFVCDLVLKYRCWPGPRKGPQYYQEEYKSTEAALNDFQRVCQRPLPQFLDHGTFNVCTSIGEEPPIEITSRDSTSSFKPYELNYSQTAKIKKMLEDFRRPLISATDKIIVDALAKYKLGYFVLRHLLAAAGARWETSRRSMTPPSEVRELLIACHKGVGSCSFQTFSPGKWPEFSPGMIEILESIVSAGLETIRKDGITIGNVRASNSKNLPNPYANLKLCPGTISMEGVRKYPGGVREFAPYLLSCHWKYVRRLLDQASAAEAYLLISAIPSGVRPSFLAPASTKSIRKMMERCVEVDHGYRRIAKEFPLSPSSRQRLFVKESAHFKNFGAITNAMEVRNLVDAFELFFKGDLRSFGPVFSRLAHGQAILVALHLQARVHPGVLWNHIDIG